MQVVFRADASSTIGHGHVMRCLALAQALRDEGADCVFISRPDDGDLRDRIAEAGFEQFPIADLTATTMAAALDAVGFRPDWLVVDHYRLDREWEAAMRRHARSIMAIDDRPRRPHECDVLLDQNIVHSERDLIAAAETTALPLIGLEYVMLQPEYRELRATARTRSGPVRRILITFGGSDRFGLTLSTLRETLARTTEDVRIDVVTSRSMQDRAAVDALAAATRRVTVHRDLPTLAPLIHAADLAIGAAGSTSWERLCLGLPSLVFTLADNQVPIAEALGALGLATWVGDTASSTLADALEPIAARGLDEEWSRRCLGYVDGKGSARVAAVLTAAATTMLRARVADAADEARLLRWANDPVTRQDSFSQRAIAPGEHHQWFQKLLHDAAARQYIVETHRGAEVGQVRFQRHDDEWEVHYALAPEFRGRRLGRKLLQTALDEFRRGQRARVIGRVKSTNTASQKIFQALGFDRERADAEIITYAIH